MHKWNPPHGWEFDYGSVSFALSGDGAVYWGLIGSFKEGTNHGARGFGFYVFRQEGQNQATHVPLGGFIPDHGWLVKDVNALYCVGFQGNTPLKDVRAVPIQGYVPTNQENLENIPAPQLPSVVDTADQWARQRITSIEQRTDQANNRVREVTAQLRHHLENHPQAHVDYDGLINNSLHTFWARFPDRLYVEIQENIKDPNRPLSGLIRHIVNQK